MVILFFGDIFGRPGRRAVAAALPFLKEKYRPDFIFGNAENLAGGRGTNWKTTNEMLSLGFDGLTSGNHIWDNKEIYQILESESRLLRPLNLPSSDSRLCPGQGARLFRNEKGDSVYVINVMGRVFMDAIECPFAAVEQELVRVNASIPILVDFHADATSEKNAMGWFLDGQVTAVVGTHSHIQTADDRLLPKKTAYISDIGLSGSFDSVIGMDPKPVLQRYLTRRPTPFRLATENPGVCCVAITTGEKRKAVNIERVRMAVQLGPDGELTND